MEDVNYDISLAIEDILSLINYCSVDKKARNLCNKRSFWQQQFNRFRLPLDDHIQYDNPYEWIQLLLKTKNIMEKLNKLNERPIISVLFKKDILLTDILNVIKNESEIDVSDLQPYFDDNYDDNDDFIQGLKENYPFMINEILITKRGNRYFLALIINNIEDIPGGVEFLQDSDEIAFNFRLKKHELENIIINLIPYL